jgi:hypothetical protein
MSQLTLSAIPGFFDLADSAIAAGQPLTDTAILAMSHNAKFATVRGKLIFMGFYANGNTVPTPIDADDYYAYSRAECQFMFMPYSNRTPAPGFVPGQAQPPAQSDSQPGPLYNWPGGWAINDLTGLVTLWTTYYANGVETVNKDGIIKVYALCRRNQAAGTAYPAPPVPSPAPAPPPAVSGYRPTAYQDQGAEPTLDPTSAYDGNLGTYAQVIGLAPTEGGVCLWFGFPGVPISPTSSVSLSVFSKQIVSDGTPSSAVGTNQGAVSYTYAPGGVYQSGGIIRQGSTGWDASTTPDVVSLPAGADLAGVVVTVVQEPPGTGEYAIDVYDIVITVTA